MEGNGCGLIWGTVPVYAWCETKSMETLVSMQDPLNTKQAGMLPIQLRCLVVLLGSHNFINHYTRTFDAQYKKKFRSMPQFVDVA
jgi:hypothetical protein